MISKAQINAKFEAAMNAGVVPGIREMTEAQFVAEITRRCGERGIRWMHIDNVHHTRRRGSQEGNKIVGFPDLLLVGRAGIMFRECKSVDGAYRGLRPAQADWKYALRVAGQDWALWSPADLESGRIDQELDQLAGRSSGE